MIPTRDECLRLMAQYGMQEHIKNHCLEVAKVALFLAAELNRMGQKIDLGLVEAASLLHDLTKEESFKTKEDHARTGSRLLKELGYERVGEVVAEHVHLLEGKHSVLVSEEEVVNYADKRVMHDRIVTLEERLDDLKERYGRNQEAMEYLERMEKTTYEMEQKIISILRIDPDDLCHL